MNEIIFLVEEAPECGYTARALGESIFTEAETVANLRGNVRAAVECHFEDGQAPKIIRLHHVTVPDHDPVKVGTLANILRDLGEHFGLTKDELLNELFG